jgi:hypothetical protein
MSRVVLRFADWTIGPERDEDGHARTRKHAVRCRTCEEMSKPGQDQSQSDRWAMRHAAVTGHRDYGEIITVFLPVRLAPTNPLYEQEAAR